MDQNYSMGFGALLSKIDFKWTVEYQMVENAKGALTDAENNLNKNKSFLESCERDRSALTESILEKYGKRKFEEMAEQTQKEVLKKQQAIIKATSMAQQAQWEVVKQLRAIIKATKTYLSMKNLTIMYEQMSVGFMFDSARTYHEKESETFKNPKTRYLGRTIAGVIALFLEHPRPKYRKQITDIFAVSDGNRYITAALGALVDSSFLYMDDATSNKMEYYSLNGHYCHELPLTFCRLPEGVDGDLDCDKFQNNYTLFKERHTVTPYYNPRATVTDKANNIIFPIMPHVREMRIMKRSTNYKENLFTRTTCHQEVIDLLSDEERKEEDEK